MLVQVSVVIPVYNGESFVERAVRSALAQTVQTVEVLVADNGSTDGTWSILRNLAAEDSRVRPLQALDGRGPDVARNACLDVAQGEWIAVLDADDVMHPARLERLLAFAALHKAELVADNLRLVAPDGRFIRNAWAASDLPDQVDTAAFVMANLFGQKDLALGYVKPMIRRALLSRTGLRYAAEPRIIEDYQFMFALLQTGVALHLLAEPYYDYVQTPGSLSRTSFNTTLAAIRLANINHMAAATGDRRLSAALARRQRSIDRALAHDAFVLALKARRPDRAVWQVVRRPDVVSFIAHYGKESLSKRLGAMKRRLTGGGGPAAEGALVAYFGQDCTDNAVIRRIAAFQSAGLAVLGFTFRRRKFNRDFVPTWDDVALGETRDRDYRGRMRQMVRAAWVIFRQRRRIATVSFFYARNIDMALLAWFARRVSGTAAPLAYEVLDVQRALLGDGPRARLLRWVERRILGQARLLVVSSPGFVREYFLPVQGYKGEWFLLENKILGTQLAAMAESTGGASVLPRQSGRWVVGWFGTLRCTRSLDILAQVAAALPGQVTVYLRGFPTETGLTPFLEVVARHPNMVYGGEFFSPRDLPQLYGAIDFAWGFDFLDQGNNSDWLLPNRFYDAGYHNVPLLAAVRTQTGRRVDELGMGWTFSPPYELSLTEFFRTVTPEAVSERRVHMATLPRSLFCEEDDTRRLIQTVMAAPAARLTYDPPVIHPDAGDLHLPGLGPGD